METFKTTVSLKNLLLLGLIVVVLSAKAQEFAPIGASWYYSESNGGAAPPNSEYIHYESVKDTTINGVPVRKIIRTYYRYSGSTSVLSPLFVYSSNDTVFLYNPDKDYFGKLYIFNANKGDTLELDVPYGDNYPNLNRSTYRLVIDSVIDVSYNNVPIKKYQARGLDDFQFWNNGWFIDFAGGLDWFFPRGVTFPEAGGPLRCYHDNNLSVNFTSLACDYRLINSVPEVKDKSVSIYPNPVADKMQIVSSKQIEKCEIFDYNGVLKISDNKPIIDVSQLKTGLYIIRVIHQDKTMIYKTIIKEKRDK
jgi:hypothetical protein